MTVKNIKMVQLQLSTAARTSQRFPRGQIVWDTDQDKAYIGNSDFDPATYAVLGTSGTLGGIAQAKSSDLTQVGSDLQDNIDAEAAARAAADSAEVSARQSADTQLQDNIDAEAAARVENDSVRAETRYVASVAQGAATGVDLANAYTWSDFVIENSTRWHLVEQWTVVKPAGDFVDISSGNLKGFVIFRDTQSTDAFDLVSSLGFAGALAIKGAYYVGASSPREWDSVLFLGCILQGYQIQAGDSNTDILRGGPVLSYIAFSKSALHFRGGAVSQGSGSIGFVQYAKLRSSHVEYDYPLTPSGIYDGRLFHNLIFPASYAEANITLGGISQAQYHSRLFLNRFFNATDAAPYNVLANVDLSLAAAPAV